MRSDPVGDLLGQVSALLDEHGRDDLRARLELGRAAAARQTSRVVVVGEFKKGKSSLINAVLGARVCATDADIATAVPTYVRYGDRLEASVLSEESPHDATAARLDPGDVEAAVTGHGPPAARAVEVRLPRELLAGGTEIVDTPGISGGLASTHAGVALRALTGADVLLFVTDAGAELSGAELDFLRQVAGLCPVVVGAVTKTDVYPHWATIQRADAAHLRDAGLAVDLYPVSSPLRHHGLREGDRELLAESGYPFLVARLVDERARGAGARRASAVAVASSVLGELGEQLRAQERALASTETLGQQRAELEEAVRLAADLRGAGSRWQQVLVDQVADLFGEAEVDLTMRIRALRRETSEHIAGMPPARMMADLGPWLQQRTTELLLDHQRAVRSQSERVVDAVAEQFGTAARRLRAGVDAGTELSSPAPDAAFDALRSHGGSRFDLGLVAVRGGSAGVMLSHAVMLVLGLTIPAVLPATVVLSGFLAAKSWQGARASQLRVLRAETERAVVSYLEDVDTVARKDTRDAVRRLQRRLREVFGERAAELSTTVTRAAEALAAAVAEGEKERETRLADVERALAEVRALQEVTMAQLARLVPGAGRRR